MEGLRLEAPEGTKAGLLVSLLTDARSSARSVEGVKYIDELPCAPEE